jgi:hypothetical protein
VEIGIATVAGTGVVDYGFGRSDIRFARIDSHSDDGRGGLTLEEAADNATGLTQVARAGERSKIIGYEEKVARRQSDIDREAIAG